MHQLYRLIIAISIFQNGRRLRASQSFHAASPAPDELRLIITPSATMPYELFDFTTFWLYAQASSSTLAMMTLGRGRY